MDVAAIAMASKIDQSKSPTESAPQFITYDPKQENNEPMVTVPKGLRQSLDSHFHHMSAEEQREQMLEAENVEALEQQYLKSIN